MENDQGPTVAVVLAEFLLDDGPDALEKVFTEPGLRPRGLRFVRHHNVTATADRIDIPGKILLNSYRKPCSQSSIEPIAPLAVVWVAIVRVQNRSRLFPEPKRRLRNVSHPRDEQPTE